MRFRKVWMSTRLPGRHKVEAYMRILCVGEDWKDKTEAYYRAKMRLLLGVLAGGMAVFLLVLVQALRSKDLFSESFLVRREEAYETELELRTEGEAGRKIYVEVKPQQLSRAECEVLTEQLKKEMGERILGENKSLEEVRTDLNLMTELELEGVEVEVHWELDSYEVLKLDGSIRKEQVKEEGTIVGLRALICCGEAQCVYEGYANVYPPLLSAEAQFDQELQKKIEVSDEASSETDRQELPKEAGGKALTWKERRTRTPEAVLLLTFLSVGLLYVMKDGELKNQLKEREQQMCRDYAQIVSKLVLMLGAGATIRNAWEQLVQDYEKKRALGEIERRYAYEEMKLTCREMQNGVSELCAYESFGKRCRVPCYRKLSMLLEQNLQKGSKGVTVLLQAEVSEAFEQRKDLARRRGEEASTKLLLPMMLMLVVVMALIMIPAMLSMQIV